MKLQQLFGQASRFKKLLFLRNIVLTASSPSARHIYYGSHGWVKCLLEDQIISPSAKSALNVCLGLIQVILMGTKAFDLPRYP